MTGGASGIGLAVAQALRGQAWAVVTADVAHATDGDAVRCDVTSWEDNQAAVAHTEQRYGRLDFAFLNAGIATGFVGVEEAPLERVRQVIAVDVESVFYGLRAALPALRRSGGGDVLMTASLAGLTAVPFDPVYAMAKHAVVGLARSVGPTYAVEGIRVNALCPGFADTPIIDPLRPEFERSGMPVLPVADVAGAVLEVLGSGAAGEAFLVRPGGSAEAYRFRGVPGPALSKD